MHTIPLTLKEQLTRPLSRLLLTYISLADTYLPGLEPSA